MEANRTHLESLSTTELIALADEYGIDIPEDLERIFIIEELLEFTNIYASYTTEIEEEINIIPSYLESVALPKQYNISYIDIIQRDPLWVYAFWEVKESDKELYENNPDFKGYFLRIIPVNEDNTAIKTKEDAFIIPIKPEDDARYIGFAEHSASDANRFVIKLGVLCDDKEFQIAISRPFDLPRLLTNDELYKMKENILIKLSGITDLPVIIERKQ